MKLKTPLFLVFILMAQDWSTYVYKYGTLYPGYVIDADGKKTEGFIKYQSRI